MDQKYYAVANDATGEVSHFVRTEDDAQWIEQAPSGYTSIEITEREARAFNMNGDLCMMDGQTLVARPKSTPVITDEMVKAEAERRIIARYPLGKQNTIMMRGGSERDDMQTFIEAMIAASHRIELMRPIPPDFAADHHWN